MRVLGRRFRHLHGTAPGKLTDTFFLYNSNHLIYFVCIIISFEYTSLHIFRGLIMTSSTVNFRMDSDLKKKMEFICDDIGMNLSTAFTIFAKRFVRENGMPFPVDSDPFYSEANMKFLEESIKELKEGKGVEHELIEVD